MIILFMPPILRIAAPLPPPAAPVPAYTGQSSMSPVALPLPPLAPPDAKFPPLPPAPPAATLPSLVDCDVPGAVSYTHLTLPTSVTV